MLDFLSPRRCVSCRKIGEYVSLIVLFEFFLLTFHFVLYATGQVLMGLLIQDVNSDMQLMGVL